MATKKKTAPAGAVKTAEAALSKPDAKAPPAPAEKPAAPAPPAEPKTRDQRVKEWTAPQPHDLDKLLEKGDLVARYLEAHGQWEEHSHLTALGRRNVRVLRYCECPICQDAVTALGLT